jgi:hypothetical protein
MGQEIIINAHAEKSFTHLVSRYKGLLPGLFRESHAADFVTTHDRPFNGRVLKDGKEILLLTAMLSYKDQETIDQSFSSPFFSFLEGTAEEQAGNMSEGMRKAGIFHTRAWLPAERYFKKGEAILIPFPNSARNIRRALVLTWEVPDFRGFAPVGTIEAADRFAKKYPTETGDIMRTWRLISGHPDILGPLFGASQLFAGQIEINRKIYSEWIA